MKQEINKATLEKICTKRMTIVMKRLQARYAKCGQRCIDIAGQSLQAPTVCEYIEKWITNTRNVYIVRKIILPIYHQFEVNS